MNTRIRLLTVVLLGLSLGIIGGAHATYASGTQVQDCTFATLKADLELGGDWYYAAGQCSNDIFFTDGINISTSATVTAQGDDVVLVRANNIPFTVSSVGSLGLTGLQLVGSQSGSTMVSNSGGTLSITHSDLSGNKFIGGSGSGFGGAINNIGGTVTITQSVLDNNEAAGFGGAIYNTGTLTVTNSAIVNNQSDSVHGGGAVFNGGGTVAITNSTMYDDTAYDIGGALVTLGSTANMTVTNSTLWDNIGRISLGGPSTDAGQQIEIESGTLHLAGTIIANPFTSAANCNSPANTEDYNLDTDGSCLNGGTGDTTTSSPGLDPAGLKNNGGYTPTIALVAGSPAIDAIPLSYDFTGTIPLCPATDQRGISRPDIGESYCDIGAYEAPEPTTTTLASTSNPSVVGQQVTYTAAVAPIPDGGTVTFYDGGTSGTAICSQVPVITGGTGAGTAVCSATYNTTGSHSITGVYSGDTSYMSSTSSALIQAVNKASTTTLVTSTSNPSIVAQPVTFTAAVSVTAPGAGTPTGTVTFMDGAATLGSFTLDATGTATLQTSSLTAGTHAITASYTGDASFTGSSSSMLSQQVSYVISTLATTIGRKGTTIDVQVLNFDSVNVSVKTLPVTALCVVPYSLTAPTNCPSNPIQSINSPFTFVKNDMRMGSGYSYTVSPTGLTAGAQYYLLVQADGDPVYHAITFSD